MDNDNNDINVGMSDVKLDTLDISMSSLDTTYTIPISSYYYGATGATGSSHSYGNVTINSNSTISNTALNTALYTTSGFNGTSGLHVSSDAEFEGDIKWKGRSLGKLLEKIEDRLAILQEPDPAKLEKHAALKKAYDHYKTLERLIGED